MSVVNAELLGVIQGAMDARICRAARLVERKLAAQVDFLMDNSGVLTPYL